MRIYCHPNLNLLFFRAWGEFPTPSSCGNMRRALLPRNLAEITWRARHPLPLERDSQGGSVSTLGQRPLALLRSLHSYLFGERLSFITPRMKTLSSNQLKMLLCLANILKINFFFIPSSSLKL